MKRTACVLVGLFLLFFTGCKAADSEDNTDSDNGNDTGNDSENDTDSNTDHLELHWGCTEKQGEQCLEITDGETCEANENCHFGYGSCLPNGYGCRKQGSKAACEELDYCVFKTWEEEPCLPRCVLYEDQISCEKDETCAWNQFVQCIPKKDNECFMQEDKDACESVDGCKSQQLCAHERLCPTHRQKDACEEQDNCTWQDDMCRFKCELKHVDEESCNADTELGCKWHDRYYICYSGIEEADAFACFMTPFEECGDKEECHPMDICQAEFSCVEFETADECEEHAECTAGLCEHACTPKKSKPGCEEKEECMWIPIYFEAGQKCSTACH